MEPKEKKRKKIHDPPREHDGKDAPPDETTRVTHEQPQKEASKVNGSSEGFKSSENGSQSKTQPPTEGLPETSGDKKVKRKKEKREKARLTQGDVSKETITPPEPTAPSVDDNIKDDKKSKKRKHKEKREEVAEANHGGTAGEAATKLELLASQTDDAKGERKKKKSKEEKATGEKREETVVNDVGKKRKHR
jgi:hypothetical protein